MPHLATRPEVKCLCYPATSLSRVCGGALLTLLYRIIWISSCFPAWAASLRQCSACFFLVTSCDITIFISFPALLSSLSVSCPALFPVGQMSLSLTYPLKRLHLALRVSPLNQIRWWMFGVHRVSCATQSLGFNGSIFCNNETLLWIDPPSSGLCNAPCPLWFKLPHCFQREIRCAYTLLFRSGVSASWNDPTASFYINWHFYKWIITLICSTAFSHTAASLWWTLAAENRAHCDLIWAR